MPYRIKKSDDGIEDAVGRIADEQIGRAVREIAGAGLPFDEKAHQVRKRCKKLRGPIRLVRPGCAGYRQENKTFRDAARLMSSIRDADTLIATYDALMDHFVGETERRSFAPIRARLTLDAAAEWQIDGKGFDVVSAGVRKTYKRTRKRMDAAWADPTDEAMHDWRKRVKYHWYHTRLLRPIHPQMMGRRENAPDELSDLLGDHHDLAVLAKRLLDVPEDFGPNTGIEAFRTHLQQRKQALSDRAFESGRLLLAERSKALVMRWEGYWTRWRAGDLGPGRLLHNG